MSDFDTVTIPKGIVTLLITNLEGMQKQFDADVGNFASVINSGKVASMIETLKSEVALAESQRETAES